MSAKLSKGFRIMLSTTVTSWTLSLHLWKALEITFSLAVIHTALELQNISRSEYTTLLSSEWGFHSVKLLALSFIVAKALGFSCCYRLRGLLQKLHSLQRHY